MPFVRACLLGVSGFTVQCIAECTVLSVSSGIFKALSYSTLIMNRARDFANYGMWLQYLSSE